MNGARGWAAASNDGTVRLWDVAPLGGGSRRPADRLAPYLIRQAATLGRRPPTATSARSGWVPQLAHDGVAGCIGRIQGGGEEAPALALSNDGRFLFVGNSEGRLRCQDLLTDTVT